VRFTVSLSLLISSLTLLNSCGFRDGWGEDEQVRSDMTAEQYCEANEGFSWVDEKCQKDSFLLDDGGLSETQCKNVKDAYWVDQSCSHYSRLVEASCASFPELVWHGEVCAIRAKVECEAGGKLYDEGKCVERPAVTFTGSLKQSLERGGQLTPIAYQVSQGAVLTIKSTTCEGFFQLKDGKVVSNPEYKLEDSKTSCEANLVVLRRSTEVSSHTVVVDFGTGFLSYCNDQDADAAIFYTVKQLRKLTGKTDCKSAAEVLSTFSDIELEGVSLLSNLDPFSGLNNLISLAIVRHSVTTIPPSIAKLASLKWLDLRGGDIADISNLAGSTTIKYLYLDGNPIADAANRTEENCPTKEGINKALRDFCLN
jgi:hypothetical protein